MVTSAAKCRGSLPMVVFFLAAIGHDWSKSRIKADSMRHSRAVCSGKEP
jgi:hypothetical protein